jgi:hypothetical protein
MKKKSISFFLILILTLSISQANAFSFKQSNKEELIIYSATIQNDEIVWWNTTELDPEPYTAPFFKVYKLKDFGNSAYGLDVTDFNKDGFLDFISSWSTSTGDYQASISIFYRISKRSFNVKDIKKYNNEIEDLDAIDLNNDGEVDIFCSRVLDGLNNEYSINIIYNEDGSFKQEAEIAHFNRSNGNWINIHTATADFDKDGDTDFIVGANCGKVKLFKNDGNGNFTDEGIIFDYGDASWGLDTGDFNNDGYPDFIVCARTNKDEYPFNDEGHIYIKFNDQTNSCFNNSNPGKLLTSLPFESDDTIGKFVFGSIAVLDYNNDNLLDVVYGGDYKIFMLIQQNNGTFKPFYTLGLRDREYTWTDHLAEGGFAVGDFNYDGYDDVLVGGTNGTVRLLINNQTFISIVKPVDRYRYVFGEPKFHLKYPGMKVIIGDIEVIAEGLKPLSRVDFYLNNNLIYSDTTKPYTWNWKSFAFGKCQVTAIAYDTLGEFAGKDLITAWKFL